MRGAKRECGGMISIITDEDERQYAMLTSPPGPAFSGRARYAAAMYFYMRRMIGDDVLEVYRIRSGLDREEPRLSLERRGMAHEIAGAVQRQTK